MAAPDSSDDKPDVMMVERVVGGDDLEGKPKKASQVFHVDGFSVLGLSQEDADFYQNYSLQDRKKTMHKVSDCTEVVARTLSPS